MFMKLFKICADNCGYNEYDSIVVACESKEKLQELIDKGVFNYHPIFEEFDDDYNYFSGFYSRQQLSIVEIDLDNLTRTTIIGTSYNAG